MPIIGTDAGPGSDPASASPTPGPILDPSMGDLSARLMRIEKQSGGTLPTHMSLALAQGPMTQLDLDRAARQLSAQFDLTPDLVFKPYTAVNIGQGATNPWYADPVTGGPISLSTARRFMQANEETIVRTWLEQMAKPRPYTAVASHRLAAGDVAKPAPEEMAPGTDPRNIARIFAAFAPVSGEGLSLQDALGAAASISASGVVWDAASLAAFQANLQITSKATALSPADQIAAAQTATAKGITLREIGDIPGAIINNGPIAELAAAGQAGVKGLAATAGPTQHVGGTTAPWLGAQGVSPLPNAAVLETAGQGYGPAVGKLNIAYARTLAAGLTVPGDWFKFVHDQTLDYAKAGDDLARQAIHPPIPLANTRWGHDIIHLVGVSFRPFDALYRAVASPLDPLMYIPAIGLDVLGPVVAAVRGKSGAGFGHYTALESRQFMDPGTWAVTGHDMASIWLGNASATGQLEKEYGVPAWNTALGELALSFLLPKVPGLQVLVDPMGASLQGWEAYKARFLISGLAADGRSAEAAARVVAFRDGPVARIGSLRDISVTDYLIREASRTKDPEMYFNRAVESFSRWAGSDGIDKIAAGRIFTAVQDMRKLGAPEGLIHDAVGEVIDSTFGIMPRPGGLADQIRTLAETQAAASTRSIEEEIGARLGAGTELATRNKLVDSALATLDDASWEAKQGFLRGVEIPHRAGPLTRAEHVLREGAAADTRLGRMLRGAFQESPPRSWPHLDIPIEQSSAPADFRRVLIRSNVYTASEQARENLNFAKILNPLNPDRETQLQELQGRIASEIFHRSAARAGFSPELADQVMNGILERTRSKGMGNIFGVLSKDLEHPLPIDSPFFASHLENTLTFIDPVILRQGFTEIAGRLKTWERSVAQEMGKSVKELQASDAVKVPIARWQRQVIADGISQAFLTVWKPWLILRPAHIMRVVVAQEQTKILGIIGLQRLLEAGKRTGPLMERLGFTENKYLPIGRGLLPEMANQRNSTLEDALLYLDKMASSPPITSAAGEAMLDELKGIEGKITAQARIVTQAEAEAAAPPTAQMIGGKMVSVPRRPLVAGQTVGFPETISQLQARRDELMASLAGTKAPMGFVPADIEQGRALAAAVRAGGLAPDLRKAALELVATYKGELAQLGIDTTKFSMRANSREAAIGAVTAERNIAEGNLRLRVSGLLADDPLADANFNRLVMGGQDTAAAALKGLSPELGVLVRTDKGYLPGLYSTLANQYGRDAVGQRMLKAVYEGVDTETAIRDQMTWLLDKGTDGPGYAKRLMARTAGDHWSPEDLRAKLEIGNSYARSLTEANPALARAAYQGSLTMDGLRAIPIDDLPEYVHGHLTVQQFFNRGPMQWGADLRSSLARNLLQRPTNALSRQKFFKDQYTQMFKGLLETESARNPGVAMTMEKVAGFQQTSRNFALDQVDRILYNWQRTNRFAEMTRMATVFTHPFLAFPITWARVLKSNPSLIREVMYLGRAGLQSGFIHTDDQTGEYVISESWFGAAAPLLAMVTGARLGPGFKGGGWSLSAPLTSFVAFSESAFPLPLPGGSQIGIPLPPLSPLFEAAMQQYVKRSDLPTFIKAPLSSFLFQYGEVTPTSVLPSYLSHALDFFSPNDSDINHFMQVRQAMGIPMNTPAEKAEAIKHATWQAREFALLRGLFAGIFPAAPKVNFPTQELENEYRNLLDPTTGLGYEAGRAEFLKQHPDLSLLTIARTLWNPDNPSPVPIPANKFVERLLMGKGAEQFAKDHPEWVFALIPSELQDAKFDAGSFFAQIASGQRVAKTPTDFLAEADVQAGWDSYFTEQTIHTNWVETHPGIGPTDPGYVAENGRHKEAVNIIGIEHPAWYPHSGQIDTSGVDPAVLRPDGGMARQLAVDPIFSKTDVGAGLGEYVKLHDETYAKLSAQNITTLDSTAATSLGITGDYEQAVNAIVAAHPDFATAYRLFFRHDMRAGAQVMTAGELGADAIRAKDPAFYESVLNPWWTQLETLRSAPDMAPAGPAGDAMKSAAYEAIRTWVNASYDKFPDARNPMILRWGSWGPLDRQSYLASLIGRPYEYVTRFDKAALMGTQTNTATEQTWSDYEQLRSAISQRRDADPNFSASAAYKALDQWVLAQAAANPAFGQQVMAANTLGYSFAKVRAQLFPSSPQTDASWAAFLDGVGQVQSIVERYNLHGASDRNPALSRAYSELQAALQAQADAISKTDIGFAQQFALLEKWSGSTSAIEQYFLPPSYFAIGSTALVGTASP